jgi:hypothetical protein
MRRQRTETEIRAVTPQSQVVGLKARAAVMRRGIRGPEVEPLDLRVELARKSTYSTGCEPSRPECLIAVA